MKQKPPICPSITSIKNAVLLRIAAAIRITQYSICTFCISMLLYPILLYSTSIPILTYSQKLPYSSIGISPSYYIVPLLLYSRIAFTLQFTPSCTAEDSTRADTRRTKRMMPTVWLMALRGPIAGCWV